MTTIEVGKVPDHTRGMALSTDEVRARLVQLERWAVEGDAIRRQYTFDGFASAVAFVVRVGFDAEAADHHPDILISNYKKVTFTFTTHSAGGLTEKDFTAAGEADRVFETMVGKKA